MNLSEKDADAISGILRGAGIAAEGKYYEIAHAHDLRWRRDDVIVAGDQVLLVKVIAFLKQQESISVIGRNVVPKEYERVTRLYEGQSLYVLPLVAALTLVDKYTIRRPYYSGAETPTPEEIENQSTFDFAIEAERDISGHGVFPKKGSQMDLDISCGESRRGRKRKASSYLN